MQPPGAIPGDAYLNGLTGGGVLAFALAGKDLSVPYGFGLKQGCGADIVLNEDPYKHFIKNLLFYSSFI